jgi:hypothetical protein
MPADATVDGSLTASDALQTLKTAVEPAPASSAYAT